MEAFRDKQRKSQMNKKNLITGADGFIGSHLTEKLVKCGAKIKALSYYSDFEPKTVVK
jgi:nucleoside-diphosphate-sugar epimerase